MKPRLLDLFCGAGGATKGYQEAGFYVVGVDTKPQPNYVGDEFIEADALELLELLLAGGSICTHAWSHGETFLSLTDIDAIHASPPCHDKSALRHVSGEDGSGWLLPATISLLRKTGLPYVVENVVGAEADLGGSWFRLCGAAFGLRTESKQRGEVWLRRHRLFASNVPMLAPPCACGRGKVIGVYGHGDGGGRGWKGSFADRKAVMGIDWMNRNELAQAIPPAYTRHIGSYLLSHIKSERSLAA